MSFIIYNKCYLLLTTLNIVLSYKTLNQSFIIQYNSPKLDVYFGTPGQNQNIQLSLTYPRTWVSPGTYEIANSSTGIRIKEDIMFPSDVRMSLFGFEARDVMKMNDTEITMDFFVLQSGIVFQFGIIGLAREFEDEKYSFIHQLKKNNLIDYNAFGFDFDNSTIYFGKFPYEKYSKDKYKISSCDVTIREDRPKENWACELDRVFYISNNTKKVFYNNHIYSHFSISSMIIAPDSFLSFLNETQFKIPITNNKCEFTSLKEYECDEDIIDSFGNLYFVFNGVGFMLNNKILWNKKQNRYSYGIQGGFHVFTGMKDEWILGSKAWQVVNTEFDYDKQKVSFIIPLESILILNKKIINRIYIMIILLSVFEIIILSINLCGLNNK